jgi:hypothetical protein
MNRERWLLFVSILIFVGLAVYYLAPRWVTMTAKKRSPSLASKPAGQQLTPKGPAGQSFAEVVAKGEAINEQSPWGRNPFLTEEEEAKGKDWGGEGLQVKAIITGGPKSVATIDGRAVVAGEKIGEETVSEIRPDAVILERDGRRRMLRVTEPSISVETKEGKK